jgi:hypothetical protein
VGLPTSLMSIPAPCRESSTLSSSPREASIGAFSMHSCFFTARASHFFKAEIKVVVPRGMPSIEPVIAARFRPSGRVSAFCFSRKKIARWIGRPRTSAVPLNTRDVKNQTVRFQCSRTLVVSRHAEPSVFSKIPHRNFLVKWLRLRGQSTGSLDFRRAKVDQESSLMLLR